VKLNKADLRLIYTSLGRLIPPFGRAPDAAEVVAIGQLRDVVADAIRDFAPVLERGELVFSWRVPREQALTMNAYAHKKGWMKKKMRQELDKAVVDLLPVWPRALMNGAKVRRWVRVTRFSTQRVDDLSVDILGGKMPVDALVRCGVLSDDNDAMAFREPRWEKTERGNTHVLVEVFTIREETEGHENDDPPDTTIAQIVRKPGPFTAWLAAGPPVKKPPPEDIF
jgi:hypothetical protein